MDFHVCNMHMNMNKKALEGNPHIVLFEKYHEICESLEDTMLSAIFQY